MTGFYTYPELPQIRRHLSLHHDRLQGFEDCFAVSKGETQRGGGQVLPL